MEAKDMEFQFALELNKADALAAYDQYTGLCELKADASKADVRGAVVETTRWILNLPDFQDGFRLARAKAKLPKQDIPIAIHIVPTAPLEADGVSLSFDSEGIYVTIRLSETSYIDASTLTTELLLYTNPTVLGEIYNGNHLKRRGVPADPDLG